MDKIPVLLPGGNLKLSWDLIHFLAVLILFIWIPLYFAFGESFKSGKKKI